MAAAAAAYVLVVHESDDAITLCSDMMHDGATENKQKDMWSGRKETLSGCLGS